MATYGPAPVDYDQLQYLRQILAPQYAVLPASRIRAQMGAFYGPDAAEDYNEYLEGLFGSIGNAFKDVGKFVAKAAPVVATVGGGALQGALSGAQFGLPGIIAGAAAGGAGAGLSKYGSGTARSIGGALQGVTGLAGQFSPLGRIGGAVGPAISSLAGGGRGGAAGSAVNALSGVLGALGGGGGAAGALSSLLGGGGGGAAGAISSLLGQAGGPAGAIGSLLGGGRGGGAAGAIGSLLGGGGGGAAGAIGSLLGGGGGGAAGAIGNLLGGASGSGGPAGALSSLFGGSGAIGQLRSLLQRQETMEALSALEIPPFGRTAILVGSAQTPVPTAAFPNLIAHLAGQASAEATAWAQDSENAMEYMMDQSGEYVGDPALDRDRAARIWNLLNEAQAERLLEAIGSAGEAENAEYGPDYSEASVYAERQAQDTAYYDAMDAAEAYALTAESEAETYPDYEYAEWPEDDGRGAWQ